MYKPSEPSRCAESARRLNLAWGPLFATYPHFTVITKEGSNDTIAMSGGTYFVSEQ